MNSAFISDNNHVDRILELSLCCMLWSDSGGIRDELFGNQLLQRGKNVHLHCGKFQTTGKMQLF